MRRSCLMSKYREFSDKVNTKWMLLSKSKKAFVILMLLAMLAAMVVIVWNAANSHVITDLTYTRGMTGENCTEHYFNGVLHGEECIGFKPDPYNYETPEWMTQNAS